MKTKKQQKLETGLGLGQVASSMVTHQSSRSTKGRDHGTLTLDQAYAICAELLIRQRGRCWITGTPLSVNGQGDHVRSFSIDRIDDRYGYSVENCRAVCGWVNQASSRIRGSYSKSKLWDQLCKLPPLTTPSAQTDFRYYYLDPDALDKLPGRRATYDRVLGWLPFFDLPRINQYKPGTLGDLDRYHLFANRSVKQIKTLITHQTSGLGLGTVAGSMVTHQSRRSKKGRPGMNPITVTDAKIMIHDRLSACRDRCEVTGWNLNISGRSNNINTFSVDRLDNQIGYQVDNIRITTQWVNLASAKLPPDQRQILDTHLAQLSEVPYFDSTLDGYDFRDLHVGIESVQPLLYYSRYWYQHNFTALTQGLSCEDAIEFGKAVYK